MRKDKTTALTQLVYTSTCVSAMTPRLSHQVSEKSVDVCAQLGLTGRVFANDFKAFAITEGETGLVQRYYEALKNDKLVESIVLHINRPMKAREFSDYSVWLNSRERYACGPHVKVLSQQTLKDALPISLSTKVKIMIEAYLKPELLHA